MSTFDIADYEMLTYQDSWYYRHLMFRIPDTIEGNFQLVTWPGALCITGDIGTYVFRRLPDMFYFFRVEKINPDYWAGKVEAADVPCGISEYSPGRAAAAVLDLIEDEDESNHPGLRDEVRLSLTPWASDGETCFRDAVDGFEYNGFTFQDFGEVELTEFTPQYLWCCEAIRQGVRMYDESKGRTE